MTKHLFLITAIFWFNFAQSIQLHAEDGANGDIQRRISEFKKEKLNILNKMLDNTKIEYNSGRATNEELSNAKISIYEVEIECCGSDHEKIAIFDKILIEIEENYKATKASVDNKLKDHKSLLGIELKKLDFSIKREYIILKISKR